MSSRTLLFTLAVVVVWYFFVRPRPAGKLIMVPEWRPPDWQAPETYETDPDLFVKG